MKILKIGLIFFTAILFILTSCKEEVPPPQFSDLEIATQWADMSIYITHYSFGNTPTYASRCFGYLGLTMYESIVNGFPGYNSLAGQLQGLDQLKKPEESKTYNWLLSLNAGQAEMLRNIYMQTPDTNKVKIDSLENLLFESIAYGIKDQSVIERSVAYGKEIANEIYEWSKTDGGHRGYLHNFDKAWDHPVFPGSWKPPLYAQSFNHHPLHPYWGKNRTFLKVNQDLPDPEMITYNEDPDSEYYKQFLAVYEQDKKLTQKDKEIAIWWGDDPDETFTPPGHSYYITTLAVKGIQPDLIDAAKVYAGVGMAVADAFIKCWKWKYDFFSERPNTFIPEHIDQEWESFWPDPPFPAFPSGHAIQAAAAAKVLEGNFGEEFTFTDTSHEGRERDEIRNVDFVPRSFTRFWDVALETADSRFFGGIHTPQDNQVGLEQGSIIAGNVNNLNWKNE